MREAIRAADVLWSVSVTLSRRRALLVVASGLGSAVAAACGASVAPAAPTNPTSPAPTPTLATATATSAPAAAAAGATLVPTAETTAVRAAPKAGGTLRMGIVNDITSLDGHNPSGAYIFETSWQVYDPLTAYDEKLQPQPMLAESWDVSQDQRQITFHLRKGVQFHSGREFTSDDVKYNLLRVRDPKSALAHSWTRATGGRRSIYPTNTRRC